VKKDFGEKEIYESIVTDKDTLDSIKESLYEEEVINRLAQIFKALADPTRLKIIYVLSKSPLCVCDIANLLDMTQSAISHHLRLLRNLRLVKFKKEGKMAIYSLDDEHVLQLFKQGMDHVKHD
jgi:DNA-binding transcriptional ArsR family regulator